MQPLDSVKAELEEDASGLGACFRDGFIRGFLTEGKKRCEAGNHGRVRGAGATHDDGEDINLSTGPVLAEGVCEESVFVADELCSVLEIVVGAIFQFPDLNIFIDE
jgi:hypothetical protein